MHELKEKLNIESMIYEIRGKQVMLDSDLAKLYDVETKRINEAVKNNPNKFPERFAFLLNNFETRNLRSKFSTSNLNKNYGGRRYNPRVFTEQGVAMLSTILKSKVAVKPVNDTIKMYKKRNITMYKNVIFISNNTFHNRFIILDKSVFHIIR